MANFGQMLAASQAFLEPQKQKALAQSESEQKEFEVEKEKMNQIKILQDLMEKEMRKASRGSWLERKLGDFGKALGFFSPGWGTALQTIGSTSQASRQKKALKGILDDPKFSKYKGTWLSDAVGGFKRDVRGMRESIDPFTTGLSTLASSLMTGKISKGVGEKLSDLFKTDVVTSEEAIVSDFLPEGDPLTMKEGLVDPYMAEAVTERKFTKDVFKNLWGNVKGGRLKDTFNFEDIAGKDNEEISNIVSLSLLYKMLDEQQGGQEFDPTSYFR